MGRVPPTADRQTRSLKVDDPRHVFANSWLKIVGRVPIEAQRLLSGRPTRIFTNS
jgi:hypothetical protein